MKAIKILGVILLIVVLVIGGGIFFLPSEVTVQRSQSVEASPSVIFARLDGMKKFNDWSPWYKLDPEADYSYEGPERGEGSKMSWSSEKDEVGSGSQWIVEMKEDEYVKTAMTFGGFEGTSYATMSLEEQDQMTKVTWTMESELNGFDKFFGLMMDNMVGPFYEEGLENLKVLAEQAPEYQVELEEIEMEPFHYISSVQSGNTHDLEGIKQDYAMAFAQVMEYMQKNKLEPVGPPMAINTEWNEETQKYVMSAGMPVASLVEDEVEGMAFGTYPGGKVIKANYFGAYEKMTVAYMDIEKYANHHGMELSGSPVEFYITDSEQEPDTSKWLTEIYFPVAE
jgi:effector-binding domain-containing protein